MALTPVETTPLDAELGADITLGFRPLGSSSAFTLLGAVDSIGAPKTTIGKVESKRLNSRRKNYRPTKPDHTMSFGMQHIPQDVGVAKMREITSAYPVPIYEWQITYSTGVTETMPAFPESYDPSEVDEDGFMTAKIGLQIVGDIVTANPAGGGA